MDLDLSFIYWGDVCGTLKEFTTVAAILVGAITLIFAFISWAEDDLDRVKKVIISLTLICIASILIGIFVPSREVVYTLGIANNLTNNQEAIADGVTSVVDYVVDKVEEIMEKSESEEN